MSSYRMKYKIGATQYNIPVQEDIAGFGSGVPLGTILPYSANSEYPPEGFLWCDGSAVSREIYPDLFALIGTTFGAGDGVDTFNLPNLNTGEFLEGSSTAGTSKDAGIPNIKGQLPHFGGTEGTGVIQGAFYSDPNKNGQPFMSYQMSSVPHLTFLDASRSSSIYKDDVTTVQPKSVTVKFIIKAFTGMSNDEALVDLTGITNDLNQKFDPRSDFIIIYPNNGTAENPANVSINNRYVMDNPFHGYYVNCEAEIYSDGEWGHTGWVMPTVSLAVGVSAFDYDGSIVVITGVTYLKALSPNFYNNPFPASGTDGVTTAPCRVKVWKIGKIPQAQ